ncbi:MAG: B12-binding domain-containing radical SAM protein [Magnetococcales bacterium]|nr:B12-binding domain-containing radical SAM protein [Magnetococcales bacterium]
MNNVVIIRLPNTFNITTPPLGIGYLLESLKKIDNVNGVFIDAKLDKLNDVTLLKKISNLSPILVGFQVFSSEYNHVRQLIPKIRSLVPDTKIILGGPHPTAIPAETFNDNKELDYIVIGEGEVALAKLVTLLVEDSAERESLADIPNFAWRDQQDVVINEKKEATDIHEFKEPAWDLLQPHRYPAIQHGTFHKSTKVVPIMTSRGCPYPCTFCAGHLVTGKSVRLRKVNDIVDEIQNLIDKYGFEEFLIEDENFTYYRDHVLDFSKELKVRNISCHFSLPNGIRLDRIDEEIVAAMSEMGVYVAGFGIESVSPRTLKAMKKSWTTEQINQKVELLQKYGILAQGGIILGFSGDTVEDIKITVDFVLKSNLSRVFFGNYIPLPGTEDFNRLIATGEISYDTIEWERYTSYYGGKLPYHPKEISEKELRHLIKSATLRFYLRPKILIPFLKNLTSPVFIKSFLFRIFRIFAVRKL